MRVGSLVYATDQGLGILARSFVQAGVVTDVMVVKHGRHPCHAAEWYPGAPILHGVRSHDDMLRAKQFCDQHDVMFFFETPFIWELIPHCRARNVKTVIMPMHECMPATWPCDEHFAPDLILNPSALDQLCFPTGTQVTVPVDPSTWRQRERARVFVHNAGHGGLKGRNGTIELMEAIKLAKSPAQFVIRCQEGGPLMNIIPTDRRVGVVTRTLPAAELYAGGDVFIFPEKFNGLSLPLQEARAAGMLVMTTDRFPNNDWLPVRPLIKTRAYVRNRIGPPYREFNEALLDPVAIAEKIDEMYDKDISPYSRDGLEWARENSWEQWLPRYRQILNRLVKA